MSDNWSDGLDGIIGSDKRSWSPSRPPDEPSALEPTFSCLSEVDLFADLSPGRVIILDHATLGMIARRTA